MRREDLLLQLVDEVVAFFLGMLRGVQRVVQPRAVFLLDLLGQRFVERQRRHDDLVGLELVVQLADGGDDAA